MKTKNKSKKEKPVIESVRLKMNWGKCDSVKLAMVAFSNVGQSVSGRHLSLLFDTARIDLQPGNLELSSVCTGSVVAPASAVAPDGFFGFATDIRGFVSLGIGSRAILTVSLGSHSQSYFFGPETIKEGGENFVRNLFSPEPRLPTNDLKVATALPPVLIVFSLAVTRETKDSFANLTLDSIDVTAYAG